MMEPVRASRDRILEAAVKVFAEKGFDGARVDEIARRASVNKALIYYYFESKDKILDVLLESTIDHIIGKLASDAPDFFSIQDPERVRELMNQMMDSLEERQDIIRVILMESLKRESKDFMLFPLVGKLLDRMYALSREVGLEPSDDQKARVMEFFTGLIPLVAYTAFHESWMKAFQREEKSLREDFIDAFIATHFAATLSFYKKK